MHWNRTADDRYAYDHENCVHTHRNLPRHQSILSVCPLPNQSRIVAKIGSWIWFIGLLYLQQLDFIGPILWGHSAPLCHALSLLLLSLALLLWTSILHCHSPGVATAARRLRYSYSWLRLILIVMSTVATPGEWQCKIRTGGVRRLAVANGPNIFQMLLVSLSKKPHRELLIANRKRWCSEHGQIQKLS